MRRGFNLEAVVCLSLVFALGCGKKGDQQKVEFDVSDETEIHSDGSPVANANKTTDERFPAPKGLSYTSGVITWQKPEKHEKVKFDYILYFFDTAEADKPGAKPMANQTASEESFKYELPSGVNGVVVKILAKTDRKLSHISAALEIKQPTAGPVVAESPKTPKVETPSTNPPVTSIPEPVKPKVQPNPPPVVVEKPKVETPASIEPLESENDMVVLTLNLIVKKAKEGIQISGYQGTTVEILSDTQEFDKADELKVHMQEKVAQSPTVLSHPFFSFKMVKDETVLEATTTSLIKNPGSVYKLMLKNKKGNLLKHFPVGEVLVPHYAVISETGQIIEVKPADIQKIFKIQWTQFTADPDECFWKFGEESKKINPKEKEVTLTAEDLDKIKKAYHKQAKGVPNYALPTYMKCTKVISKTVAKDHLDVETEVSVIVSPEFFPKIKFTETPAVVGP